MTWIRTVPYEMADRRLKKIYKPFRVRGRIDNILLAHGLRPHTLQGHMALYGSVLYHSANTVPRWLLEAIAAYVSALNQCGYCVNHHAGGMTKLLGDRARGAAIRRALEADAPEDAFDGRELVALRYARALTMAPAEIDEAEITALRAAGFDDGEILEINQIAAYFAYVNRVVLGLGITQDSNDPDRSPNTSDSPDDRSHG